MISNPGDVDERDAGLARDWLFERVVCFSTFLRENGVLVSTTETIDSVDCVSLINIANREDFCHALRAALAKRAEDYPIFERLFKEFWRRERVASSLNRRTVISKTQTPSGHSTKAFPGSESAATARRRLAMWSSPSGYEKTHSDSRFLVAYSPAETLGTKNFGVLGSDRSLQLRRSLKRFARSVATRQGRRFESSRTGVVDIRRTLREGLESGGHLVALKRRQRKISKSNIVVLCDISGSMDSYSDRLLELLYHFCNSSRAEVFAFSTRVVKLNHCLEGRSLLDASRLVSGQVDFWSSGTRIGSALGELLARYPGYLGLSTVLVVISDGWELDDLEVLDRNLRSIRCRVNGIIWLNPLADNPSYEPMAAGMRTALPYIRILAGLNIFKDSREFESTFGKSIGPIAWG